MARVRAPAARLALLAALALGCLAGAEAATCTAGTLSLSLIYADTADNSLTARCLPGMTLAIDSGCNVTLTPVGITATTRAHVPDIWSSNSASGETHARMQPCPSATRGLVTFVTDTTTTIQQALREHIYSSSYALAQTIAWNRVGVLRVSDGGATLDYAVHTISVAVTTYSAGGSPQINAFATLATCPGSLTDNTDCQADVGSSCPAGRAPETLQGSSARVCRLCRAGTYSATGDSCSDCIQGKYSQVGTTSAGGCSNCSPGTYAAGGNAVCLPCEVGTYQAEAGQGSCDPCPKNAYARWPGMKACLKCINGVARCAIGLDEANGDAPCSDPGGTPSGGYHVVRITSSADLTTCTLPTVSPALAKPSLFTQCANVTTGGTYLSIYVNEWCGVTISPITDTSCSSSSASYYSGTRISAHYVTTEKIATRLVTSSASTTTMLSLTYSTTNTADLKYWAVTNEEAKANTISTSSVVCDGVVTQTGGEVVSMTAITTCPAGTYKPDSSLGCQPCPVGTYCPTSGMTTATNCVADTYGPYLGQSVNDTACLECTGTDWTSEAGSESCNIPYYNTTCDNGYEYNPSTQACEQCPAGTKRMVGDDDTCTPCPPGKYSAAGKSECTACPKGQYSESSGLAEQDATGEQKCLYCPLGSIAVVDDETTIAESGATACYACPPGNYSSLTVRPSDTDFYDCVACTGDTYRSGEASPENNVCINIPAGYKVDSTARVSISLCPKGSYSSYSTGSRVPANSPTTCALCNSGNAYAPYVGRTACRPCPGGSYPTSSTNEAASKGNDQCTACSTISSISYRPFTDTTGVCLTCKAGKEVYATGTGNTACLPCVAGYYMPAYDGSADPTKNASSPSCLPCPVKTYQPSAGQASCLTCPSGTSTQSTGNVECTECPLGYYSPKAGSDCLPAPRGTYVNTSGATMWSPCPKGTFSNETGADACEPCSPGQFSNTEGAKTCKSCSPGTYSKSKATSCTPCQAGYTSPAGSGVCSPCKAGTYAASAGLSSCTPCPRGYQCPTVAMSAPQTCRKGYYSSKTGNRLCTPCPPNTYLSTTGQTTCLPCPQGTTTRGLTGQSICQPIRPQARRRLRL